MVYYREAEPLLTEDYIDRILMHLHGWKIEDHKERVEYATSWLERDVERDEMETIQTITHRELELFFNRTKRLVISYLWFDYFPDIPEVHESLCMWTAGLIWKKYNVKEHELIDGTNPYGYGDQLINHAKKNINNYRRINVSKLV